MQENTRDISVLKQRILQFAEHEGITKYELYQKTGISNGVFSQKSGISEENLLRFLSHYSKISLNWLIYGDGDMINNEMSGKRIIIDSNDESLKFLLTRIEELAIENASLKNEVVALQKRNNYDENDKLSIASES